MSLIKWLNSLLCMEKVLGIYRNYCNQNKIKKCFILFQLFVQNMLHAIIVIGETHSFLIGNDYTEAKLVHGGFSALTFINSASSVVAGICYSGAFMSYYKSITRVSEYFKDDKFNNSQSKIYWYTVATTISSVVFCVFRSVEILINYMHYDSETSVFIFVSVFISQGCIRVTIVFQKVMLFTVIMIVVHLTKCLNVTISAVQERVGSCDDNLYERCDITGEQIQEWVNMYRDLVNCCEKVTLCFGRQFIFSLILSMSYFMLLTNLFCSNSVLNKGDIKSMLILLSFLLTSMLPLYAGQLVRNQGMWFHKMVARLYNTLIIIDSKEVEAKLIKDLIRLIKKNPIEIKLLSNIPAGMYMLPVIFSLGVNYIIVIMQFNSVI